MIKLRKAKERGHADHGWLDTWHTFSFANYMDPAHMGFRSLRVINEDFVDPAQGFGTHPHRDMEIVTYVLDGELEHRDSMGNGSVIRPGEVQRMTAGTGVTHSEKNPSDSEPVHLLQIWILPEKEGLEPGYEQKTFSDEEKLGQMRLVASRDGRDGSVTIHQDADVFATRLVKGMEIIHGVADGRGIWIQVARGSAKVNGQELAQGDGVAIEGVDTLYLGSEDPDGAELLVFDLA